MKNIFVTLLVLFSHSTVFATEYVSGKKVFLEGFDPVSYQTEKKAVKGSRKITYVYDGVTIQFKNEKNRELFIGSPVTFMPAYKGWCAYAMAKNGKLVKINPKSFKVIKGTLYLFYDGFWGNTLKKWNKTKDKPQVRSADAFWEKLQK